MKEYKNIRPLQIGIWSESTQLSLGSVNDGNDAFCLTNENDLGILINTISMDDLMDKYNITKVNILKIDIEGAEKELFTKNTSFLKNVDVIFVETHDRFIPGTEKKVLETAKNYWFKHSKQWQFIVLTR